MKIIRDMARANKLLLSNQSYDSNKTYRLLSYVINIKVDDGYLLHNFLTGQTLLLSELEFLALQNRSDIELLEQLAKNYIIVLEKHNDRALFDTIFLINQQFSKTDYINHFVILPTMECNARCFYCFENGSKRYPMTEQTAYDVADYIEKVSKGEDVYIQWFGGEPLYNQKAIDLISSSLVKKNINFKSLMVSNGYLFDEDLVWFAKEKWNLQRVQITLDGTQDIYNKYKNYIYKDDPNPFSIVIRNIKLLLSAEIIVYIRINLGDHNENDMYDLVDYIEKEIGKSPYLHVYTWLLYETRLSEKDKHTIETKSALIKRQIALENYIENKSLKIIRPIPNNICMKACMAEDDASIVIMPDGHLGKCDHYSDKNFVGSIYSNAPLDKNITEAWKTKRPENELCADCNIFPYCRKLKNCPEFGEERCTEADKQFRIDQLKRAVLEVYRQYKAQDI